MQGCPPSEVTESGQRIRKHTPAQEASRMKGFIQGLEQHFSLTDLSSEMQNAPDLPSAF
jgi:hypothetical protein